MRTNGGKHVRTSCRSYEVLCTCQVFFAWSDIGSWKRATAVHLLGTRLSHRDLFPACLVLCDMPAPASRSRRRTRLSFSSVEAALLLALQAPPILPLGCSSSNWTCSRIGATCMEVTFWRWMFRPQLVYLRIHAVDYVIAKSTCMTRAAWSALLLGLCPKLITYDHILKLCGSPVLPINLCKDLTLFELFSGWGGLHRASCHILRSPWNSAGQICVHSGDPGDSPDWTISAVQSLASGTTIRQSRLPRSKVWHLSGWREHGLLQCVITSASTVCDL